MDLTDDSYCFACGAENPRGLHLSFEFSDGGRIARTSFIPSREHEGWAGIVHGGITAVVLDEVAAKLAHNLGVKALTARLDVKYVRPARVGERLEFLAELIRQRGRVVQVKAEARGQDGSLVASAVATMYRV